jgi:hypothetical protein
MAEDNLDYVDRKTHYKHLNSAQAEDGNLDEGTKTRWEKIKWDHLLRQSAMKQDIINSIWWNPKILWANMFKQIALLRE